MTKPSENDTREPLVPSEQKRKSSRIWVWLLVSLILAGIGWRLTSLHFSKPFQGKQARGVVEKDVAVPVTLKQSTTESFPIYLDGLGTVQPYNSALVNARVSGLLQEVRFKEGDDVKKGDVLAVIDPRAFQAQYDQAVAKKMQDTAQLQNAQILLARDAQLLKQNVIDQQTYDTQRYLVAQLQGTVQADEANEQFEKTQLDWTQITAPFSGRAGVRYVDVGNQVTVGASSANGSAQIVVINQVQPIFVSFTLPQQDLPQLREPLIAHKTLEVIALDRNNKTILSKGTLSVIDNQIDTATATVKLKAVFANDDYNLWPGQFVNVRILVNEIPDSVVVPSEAVQLGPNGSYVYVVGADNKAQMRVVKPGATEAGMTRIESGLKAGEMVVTDGQYRLQPNSLVTTALSKSAASTDPHHPKGS